LCIYGTYHHKISTFLSHKPLLNGELLPAGKDAKQLAKAVVRLLTPYMDSEHTITTDNGGKFAEHKYIAERLHTTVFFAHPYSS